ncbi:MAG: CBS domain-containing protein [Acidimicrobiales bacterium]|nr:CBS domain-containing protein [Acidimicrobiales bacterium]
MQVTRLLRGKGTYVFTVSSDAVVREVVANLTLHGVGALVVSDDGRSIAGIVSERDVVRRLHEEGPAILDARVADIMTTEVHTCSPDDDVEQLMALMTEQRVRHVPVVVEGELAGIVSIGDVVKSRIGELESERKALVEYITWPR